MTNSKVYLNDIDTIHSLKGGYEHLLKNLMFGTEKNSLTLKEPIKIHCPRGLYEDVFINHLRYDTDSLTLYYCENTDRKFTKFDFGAEDFVDMIYTIIRDNF